jgi:hypothetical protein
MSNKVITWLEKIGTDIKNDFAKAEPVAEIVVEDAGKAAEPFIAAYAPSLLPAVQATLTAIATAQAAGVNAAAGASNGVAKLASVVATVEPDSPAGQGRHHHQHGRRDHLCQLDGGGFERFHPGGQHEQGKRRHEPRPRLICGKRLNQAVCRGRKVPHPLADALTGHPPAF